MGATYGALLSTDIMTELLPECGLERIQKKAFEKKRGMM